MTPIRTERLLLRNWAEADRDLFHRINSEEAIMAWFPMRRTRSEADTVMDTFAADIARDGFGWTAAELVSTGACIGLIGMRTVDLPGILPEGHLEIGWRLVPEMWGNGYATEGARALLDHAFNRLGQDVMYAIAVPENRPSIAVMERLGMRALAEFDHPRIPETHPHLRRHVIYTIEADDFAAL